MISQPFTLIEGSEVLLGPDGIPVPDFLPPILIPDQELLLDDGKLLLKVNQTGDSSVSCLVLRGDILCFRKSLALKDPAVFSVSDTNVSQNLRPHNPGMPYGSSTASCKKQAQKDLSAFSSPNPSACRIHLPALTENDRKKLAVAFEYGVTGVMLPFVRGQADLLELKRALAEVGASALMLTGETAVGRYPVEAMEYLVRTAEEVLRYQRD